MLPAPLLMTASRASFRGSSRCSGLSREEGLGKPGSFTPEECFVNLFPEQPLGGSFWKEGPAQRL